MCFAKPCRERDPQDIGQTTRGQLLHQVGTVNLDGPRRDTEVESNQLVGPSQDHAVEYVTLARR
jgi:hypothetical protein